jgi:hypothetical protein
LREQKLTFFEKPLNRQLSDEVRKTIRWTKSLRDSVGFQPDSRRWAVPAVISRLIDSSALLMGLQLLVLRAWLRSVA